MLIFLSSQSCSDMMVDVSWRVNKSRRESHQFYEAQKSHTDYGSCCRIFPHLDFINQRTRNIPTDQYTGNYHYCPFFSSHFSCTHFSCPYLLQLKISYQYPPTLRMGWRMVWDCWLMQKYLSILITQEDLRGLILPWLTPETGQWSDNKVWYTQSPPVMVYTCTTRFLCEAWDRIHGVHAGGWLQHYTGGTGTFQPWGERLLHGWGVPTTLLQQGEHFASNNDSSSYF